MRVHFCKFTDGENRDVYVNPLLVRYFYSHIIDSASPAFTKIVFDNSDNIFVKETIGQVDMALSRIVD